MILPGKTVSHVGNSILRPETVDFERAAAQGDAIARNMRSNPKILSAIGKLVTLEIFRGFQEQQFIELIEGRKIKILDLEENQEFIKDGDTDAESFFVLIHGTAEVSKDGHSLAILGAGDPIGHYGYLGEMPRTASVISRSRCTLFQFSRNLLEQEAGVKYILLSNISKMLAKYVRMTNEQIIKLEDKLAEYEQNGKWSDISNDCRVLVRTIVDAAHQINVPPSNIEIIETAKAA